MNHNRNNKRRVCNMSKHDGKKLTYAALHSPIFVPGYGQTSNTLTSSLSGTNKGVDMTVCDPFVELKIEDKNKKMVTVLVPITQFSHLVTEPG